MILILKSEYLLFAKNIKIDGKAAGCSDLLFEIKADEEKVLKITFDTVPYVEERPNNLNTVKCGSLVFSIPIKYEKKMYEYEKDGVIRKHPYCDYELLPCSDWNYALSSREMNVEQKDVYIIPFSSEKPPVIIKAKVKKIDWGFEDGYENVCSKTPASLIPVSDEEEIYLYPYGCSKLRMTEIPVI